MIKKIMQDRYWCMNYISDNQKTSRIRSLLLDLSYDFKYSNRHNRDSKCSVLTDPFNLISDLINLNKAIYFVTTIAP